MEFAIGNSDKLNPAPDMMGAAELAPSGVLRMGLVEAPHAGLFFVEKEPLRGVTVDLGAALAKELSLPIDYRVFPNSGECTEATSRGEIDAPSCRWTRSAELRSPLVPLIISYEALIWFPARLG